MLSLSRPYMPGFMDIDETVCDSGIGESAHEVVPPLRSLNRVLQSDVVPRQRGCRVHGRGQADQAVGYPVGRQKDPVQVFQRRCSTGVQRRPPPSIGLQIGSRFVL